MHRMRRIGRRLGRQGPVCLLALLGAGCVQRIIAINSNPPGALVYLNDLEVGRTPMSKEFLWYGDYDVVLRRDGYETLKTHAPVPAPWWQWIPIDLLAEPLPLRDVHRFTFQLQPMRPAPPLAVLKRGEQLAGMLESSRLPPAKQAAGKAGGKSGGKSGAAKSRAATRPATRPARGPTSRAAPVAKP